MIALCGRVLMKFKPKELHEYTFQRNIFQRIYRCIPFDPKRTNVCDCIALARISFAKMKAINIVVWKWKTDHAKITKRGVRVKRFS